MTLSRSQTTTVSLVIHTAVILLLLFSRQIAPPSAQVSPTTLATLIAPWLPRTAGTAGGGGAKQNDPATAGHLPKAAPRQIVPPVIEITNPHPKLAMEMTIEAPPEFTSMDRPLSNLGDPLSQILSNSAGTGGPIGIGNRGHGGIGDQNGPGAGNSGGPLGTVYRPGNGVTVPVLLHSVDPEFSEEARKAKYSGTVVLHADIDAAGHPRNLRIVQSLGMGLDEKALQAVTQWFFRPGTKDGKPVAVSALIEVTFHLL